MTSMSPRARMGSLIAAGALAGGAVVGIVTQLGVATAASPSPTPTAQPGGAPYGGGPLGPAFPGRRGMRPDFRGGFGGLGPGGLPGLGGRVLHGQATVQTRNGTRVVASQDGTVSSVDGPTLVVKSSDGFVRSYGVDASTRITLNGTDGTASSLKSGDTVHVIAVRRSGGWHAVAVMDGMPPRPAFAPPGAEGGTRSG